METWTTAAPFAGLGGLLCSVLFYLFIKRAPAGSKEMVEIAEAIHDGAMAFLKREYTILAVFVAIVFFLLLLGTLIVLTEGTAIAPFIYALFFQELFPLVCNALLIIVQFPSLKT